MEVPLHPGTMMGRCMTMFQVHTLDRSDSYWATARFVVALLAWAIGSAWGAPVELATGEYAPFVSERLPEGGVTAAIVREAFKAQGLEVNYSFIPWKRGFVETERSQFVGTFPYLKTPEREAEFLYSMPIYGDQFRLFVRQDTDTKRSWTHKKLCVPMGYDTSQINAFTREHRITIEQPSKISNCFKMLHGARVDAVWASELVAYETIQSVLGRDAGIQASDLTLVRENEYFLIVSRKLPQAQMWIDRFNEGLKTIKENGAYRRIVTRFSRS